MVKALDERNASEPLVFERLDDSLGHGDGAVFPTAPKRGLMFHCFSSSAKAAPTKTRAWSEMMCFGPPCFRMACSKRLDDPSGVGAFQGCHAYDLAGEVVDGHQDVNGPQAPTPDLRGVDRPDVIGIPGRNRAGLWLLFCFLRGGRRGLVGDATAARASDRAARELLQPR